jgi:uncharacterized protein
MQRFVIELSAIPSEGITRQFSSTAADLDIAEAVLRVVRPVDTDCQFFKVNREVAVYGTLRSAVRLACSRCAEEFVLPLRLALEAIYLPVQALSSKRARELEEGDADVYSYTEPVIDIAEMVRDKLFLSIPLQPHCMAGCKGLCPSCGVNRNVISCQCAEERLGSPFELLKEWRFSHERSEE